MKKTLFMLIAILLCATTAWAVQAFPGAEGHGSDASGWRQGTLYKVTTTSDSSTGNCDVGGGYQCSLREALTASGDRVIAFTVGGEFGLNSGISMVATNGNVLIAGETAPSPGVTVKGNRLNVNSHDVVFRHTKFRIGAYDLDGGQVSGTASTDPPNNTTGELTDTSKTWSTDQWNDYTLVITSGTGSGFECFITDTDPDPNDSVYCNGANLYSLGVRSGDGYTVYTSVRDRANVHVGNIGTVGDASSNPPDDATGELPDSDHVPTFTADQYNGHILLITSGTAAGYECDITDTTTTSIFCNGVNLYSQGVRSGDDYKVITASNVVFDHCEFEWSAEKNIEVWHYTDKVTLSNCIFGEPLYDNYADSQHNIELGNAQNVCIYDSLFIHADTRNPYLYYDTDLNFVNNYLYNPGSSTGNVVVGNFSDGGFRINTEANRLESGNDTGGSPNFFFVNTSITTGEWYVDTDNYVDEVQITNSDYKPYDSDGDNSDVQASSRVTGVWWTGRTVNASSTVEDYVTYNVGASRKYGDTVTAGLISDLTNNEGYQLTVQDGVPAYPGGSGGPVTFTDPGTSLSGDYTLREIAIHKYAAWVEQCGPASPSSTFPYDEATGVNSSFTAIITSFAHEESNADCAMYTDDDLYDYTQLQIDSANTFDSDGGNPDFDTGESATNHTSISVSGLETGTNYLRVRRALNPEAGQVLWSDWSSTINFSVGGPPAAGANFLYKILGGENFLYNIFRNTQ